MAPAEFKISSPVPQRQRCHACLALRKSAEIKQKIRIDAKKEEEVSSGCLLEVPLKIIHLVPSYRTHACVLVFVDPSANALSGSVCTK